MTPEVIVWSAFGFGCAVGALVATVVLAAIMARRNDEPQFTAADLARMVERAK
jgi:hypothetical protein